MIEGDVFRLEEDTLDPTERAGARPCADLATRVDDPVPGDVIVVGKGGEGVADLPRVPVQTGLGRNPSVGRDAADRDPLHDVVDSSVRGHGAHRRVPSVRPQTVNEHPQDTIVNDSDPRYPIGPFRPSGRALTADERQAHIDTIERHPAKMRAAVEGLGQAQLDTPYREGGWTVRQVVHHVVDSHVNSYIRFKLAVTEDGPTICTYDQDAWSKFPDARTAPVEGSLAMLDALHARWVAFLRDLEPGDFGRTLHHPEEGDIDVDFLVEMYGWHCRHHEGHVTAVREREGW